MGKPNPDEQQPRRAQSPHRKMPFDKDAVAKSLKFGKGDISGFFQLFFDNTGTVLTIVFLLSINGILQPEEIYHGFLPGLGLSMFLGNLYYSVMGIRLAVSEGRSDVTCQPYGISTPAAFAFLFGILLPVSLTVACPEDLDAAACTSYKSSTVLAVGCAANFIQGGISVLLGICGPWVQRVCPTASLVSALAGVGFAFLALENIGIAYSSPIVGLIPLFLMLLLYFTGLRTGVIPEALIIAMIGTALGWAFGDLTGDAVVESASELGFRLPMFYADDLFGAIQQLGPYLGVTIPVAVTAAANTLMCWQTATKNGDVFSLRETMIADGVGTMLAACFGCPFGTTVYIGHSAYKRLNATFGYSLLNGIVYLIFTFTGLIAVVQSIIPLTAVLPLVVFVGFMVTSDAFESVPFRHLPACIFGLMPSVADWSATGCGAGVSSGLTSFAQGSLLVAMFLAAILTHMIDRCFLSAAAWCSVASLCSLFGLIHSSEVGINFSANDWSQLRFFIAYISIAAILLIVALVQRFKPNLVDARVPNLTNEMTIAQLFEHARSATSTHPTSNLELMTSRVSLPAMEKIEMPERSTSNTELGPDSTSSSTKEAETVVV